MDPKEFEPYVFNPHTRQVTGPGIASPIPVADEAAKNLLAFCRAVYDAGVERGKVMTEGMQLVAADWAESKRRLVRLDRQAFADQNRADKILRALATAKYPLRIIDVRREVPGNFNSTRRVLGMLVEKGLAEVVRTVDGRKRGTSITDAGRAELAHRHPYAPVPADKGDDETVS